jgi:hypothetical protein
MDLMDSLFGNHFLLTAGLAGDLPILGLVVEVGMLLGMVLVEVGEVPEPRVVLVVEVGMELQLLSVGNFYVRF